MSRSPVLSVPDALYVGQREVAGAVGAGYALWGLAPVQERGHRPKVEALP